MRTREAGVYHFLGFRNVTLPMAIVALFLLGSCERLELEDTINAVRDIRNAEAKFKDKYGKFGSLEELASEGLIDTGLLHRTAWHYHFELNFDDDRYQLLVAPLDLSERRRSDDFEILTLFVDESGVIRAETRNEKTANANSAPVRRQ